MCNSRQVVFGVVPILFTGLTWVLLAPGRDHRAATARPEEKPLSVEDEIRELKRRCTKLEGERRELQEGAGKLAEESEKTRADLQAEVEARKSAAERISASCADAVALVARVSPPVGTVVMWWGERNAIPAGWEICDGGEVRTPSAVLTGRKPDFTDRFPKGATRARQTCQHLIANGRGGSHNMPALKITDISGLKVLPDGKHSHKVYNLTAHQAGPDSNDDIVARGNKNRKHLHGDVKTGKTDEQGQHAHGLTGHVGKADGVNADGKDGSGANQPAFQEIFFIVRVK